ncbi:cell division protein ZipA C-terminal FtsZ-binding domain-containing protein [Halomonas sp. AOP30-A1-24]|uniref:cell division protein ZipA C-terminal FtsZ-binding domain-containing protein n=1 Tax=Halomonas sp. AOP30-A1-24 TaxID=3457698 RepID=UPI0040335F36
MDNNNTTVLLLSVASLLLAGIATAIFIYIVVPWHKRRRARAIARKIAAKAAATPPTPEPIVEPEAAAKPAQTFKQHSLFILFNQPGESTDQRLAEWLKSHNAQYDSLKHVFLISGQQPANPITVTNAFLLGELPDLYRDEQGTEAVRGISLIVKPPLHKRRNQQMHVYVELAKEVGSLLNADVLDIHHQPVTEATYATIIG